MLFRRLTRSLMIFALLGMLLSACAEDAPARQSAQAEPQTATRSLSHTPDPPSHIATRTASPLPSETATRTPRHTRTPRPTRTPPPTQPPTSTPDATSTAEAAFYNDQPACQFDPNAAPAQASSQDIDTFQFSEPRFVYGHDNTKTLLSIGEWIPSTNKLAFRNYGYESGERIIAAIDAQTQALTTFMEPELGFGALTWIPSLDGVAFGSMLATAPYTGTVWLYRETDQTPQVLFQDTFSFQWNADRTGILIQDVQSQRRPVIRSLSADTPPVVTQHLNRIGDTLDWRLPATVEEFIINSTSLLNNVDRFHLSWGGPQDRFMALGSQRGLFLIDLVEDSVCRLGYEDKHWPMGSQWSPDGRFLAVGIATQLDNPLFPIFEVIDILTGERIETPFSKLYVSEIAWSNDSGILLISAKDRSLGSDERHQLMLVDLVRQKRRVLRQDATFIQIIGMHSYDSTDLSWSADGKQIAFLGYKITFDNNGALSPDKGIYVIDVE